MALWGPGSRGASMAQKGQGHQPPGRPPPQNEMSPFRVGVDHFCSFDAGHPSTSSCVPECGHQAPHPEKGRVFWESVERIQHTHQNWSPKESSLEKGSHSLCPLRGRVRGTVRERDPECSGNPVYTPFFRSCELQLKDSVSPFPSLWMHVRKGEHVGGEVRIRSVGGLPAVPSL